MVDGGVIFLGAGWGLFHPVSAPRFTPDIFVDLVPVRLPTVFGQPTPGPSQPQLSRRGPRRDHERPSSLSLSSLLPQDSFGRRVLSGVQVSSTRHLNSSPAPGLSRTLQSASQNPRRPSASSPGLVLSPGGSARLRHTPVLKTQAPVGHRGSQPGSPGGPQEALLWGSLSTDRPQAFPAGALAHLHMATETHFHWIRLRPETGGGWVWSLLSRSCSRVMISVVTSLPFSH